MLTRRMTIGCIVCGLSLLAIAQGQTGLIASWDLDDGTGTTAADSSGQGQTATLHGGAKWQAGKTGGGVYLDGVDDYIEVPNLIRQAGSMAFWFKPDWDGSDPEDYRLFDASLGDKYFFLGKGANHADITPDYFGFYFEDAADADWQDIDFDPKGIITAGTWFHVVATWQFGGGHAFLYIDGEEAATSPNALGGLPAVYSNPRFGLQTIDYIPAAHGAKGVIDEIRFYDRVLKPGQVTDLFNGIAPDWHKAQDPNPADGALDVTAPLLQWTKGDAALFHDVYLGTVPDLTEADRVGARQPFALLFYVPGLEPGVTYYWRVDEIEADMTTVHKGDLWTFTAQPFTAYLAEPADGANDASGDPNMIVTWHPGRGAVKHHLYFGDTLEVVQEGAASADKGTLQDPTFALGLLEPLTKYYWRVDEIGLGDVVTQGPVWSFTTCLPVDDFESYTDDEGSRIYETWIDGWTNGTGSTVGNTQAPFAEQTIVHTGLQSMPLDYNNVNAPWYSEAEREWAAPQDWTVEGADTLILWIRGSAGNSADALYVVLEDSSKKTAVVTHSNPDVVKATTWVEWKIPLSSLTDVNPAKVKKLYIGVGDRASPVAGGSGRIYVDDIRVTKP
jgi:hypothetical protein